MTAPAVDAVVVEPGNGALRTALDAAVRSAVRMPFMILAGWVAAICAAWLVSMPDVSWHPERIAFAAALGIPLFFALTMFAEQRTVRRDHRMLIQGSGVLPLLLVAWLWPSWTETQQPVRVLQLALVFHLAASVLPYVGAREARGFWQYNKTLLLRALTTGIWAAVLFAALALALGAMDVLFGLKSEPKRYVQLWFIVALGFSVWFFAAGVPASLRTLEHESHYPRSLRYFVQYLLVPIVAVYLCILTAYLAKVLITRVWPSGWIGWLVSCVSVVGMLCWLLLQPLTEKQHDSSAFRWVRTFSRGFFFAILPALAMLWVALSQRIAQYGLTEPRAALFVLSIWFAVVALFYLITRSRNILVVPASLAVVALATMAGPLSLIGLSRESQLNRLTVSLRDAQLLVGDSLVAAADGATTVQLERVREGLAYMYRHHGAESLPWPLLADLDSSLLAGRTASNRRITGPRGVVIVRAAGPDAPISPWERANEAMRLLGVRAPEPDRWAAASSVRPFTLARRRVEIAEYALQLPVDVWYSLTPDSIARDPYVRWNESRTTVMVFADGEPIATIPSEELLAAFALGKPKKQSEFTLRDARGNPFLLVVHTINIGTVNGTERLESLRGDVYLRAESLRGSLATQRGGADGPK